MKRRVTPLLVRNWVVCTIKARDANIRRMTTGARSYYLAHKSTNATNLNRFQAPALLGARDLATIADSVEPRGIGKFYHIEASNAERADATVLTVRGPDVDGILASMTVTLAVKGCSLVKLHAAMAGDVSSPLKEGGGDDDNGDKQVKDVFYVVDRATGKPFRDDELEDLASALLEATQVPMNVLSIKGAVDELEKLEAHQHQQQQYPLPEEQITIVPSRSAPKRP